MNNTISKKDQENTWYWYYGMYTLKGSGDNKFFWNGIGERTRKILISEMGRLLLLGWYYDWEFNYKYNIEEWTKNLCNDIITQYKSDMDDIIIEKIQDIRHNIKKYYWKK